MNFGFLITIQNHVNTFSISKVILHNITVGKCLQMEMKEVLDKTQGIGNDGILIFK